MSSHLSPTAYERRQRDLALDRLEMSREGLIKAATLLARILVKEHGQVTSPDVFKAMWARGYKTHHVDPRWIGAVFRSGKGWKRIGVKSAGSHARPVSVWVEA